MYISEFEVFFFFIFVCPSMASRFADSLTFTGPRQCLPRIATVGSARISPGVSAARPIELLLKGCSHRRGIFAVPAKKRVENIKAASVPVTQPLGDSAEYRRQLAKSYGFKQLGEDLPHNVTLKDIMVSLPKEVFECDDVKAWKSVLISVTSCTLGLFMIAKAPWYFLPLAWVWTATAFTGLFVIGHHCAHKSFLKNKLVEDIVGTLAFLPVVFPYEPWRFTHNRQTSMSVNDTAWHTVPPEEFDSSPVLRKAMTVGLAFLRPLLSIAYWVTWHFNLRNFKASEEKRVKISLACVFAFTATVFPLIIYKVGISGWVKFWLMPWLGYHFWMSTFSMINYTAPHIPLTPEDESNAARFQLNRAVHCDYPSWIEILCHDDTLQIPHHISPRIPSYNRRAAHESIQENWGKYTNLATWNWRLVKTLMTVYHASEKEESVIPFDQVSPEEAQPQKSNA